MDKYKPLCEHLESIEAHIRECTLTFERLEQILGSPLPPSAYRHKPWWANESGASQHTQTRGWLDAGWAVDSFDLREEWVRFVRRVISAPHLAVGASHLGPKVATSRPATPPPRISQGKDRLAPARGDPRHTIALVACVGQKLETPAPARELYISHWFRLASAYACQTADEWYILSAEYGLVPPDRIIEPYERNLNEMPADRRRTWAAKVTGDLRSILRPGDHVIFLAGRAYRTGLIDTILELGCTIGIPMQHLKIGQQRHWLKEQVGS
jgi:hypothetical protein